MRSHTSHPNLRHPPTENAQRKVHRMHHEHHWITRHPRTVALILAVLVSGLLTAVASIIHLYISTGIWPLFD